MSEMKVCLYQVALNPSHPCHQGPNIENFLIKESLQTMQVGCGTAKLILLIYFSSTPYLMLLVSL